MYLAKVMSPLSTYKYLAVIFVVYFLSPVFFCGGYGYRISLEQFQNSWLGTVRDY